MKKQEKVCHPGETMRVRRHTKHEKNKKRYATRAEQSGCDGIPNKRNQEKVCCQSQEQEKMGQNETSPGPK